MWDWIKRLNTTDTQLLKQNHQLQKLLADQLKASADRESRLIECLDRVVVSRFDPPLKAQPMDQPLNNTLFPDVSDTLSIEDDGKFIETMEKMHGE